MNYSFTNLVESMSEPSSCCHKYAVITYLRLLCRLSTSPRLLLKLLTSTCESVYSHRPVYKKITPHLITFGSDFTELIGPAPRAESCNWIYQIFEQSKMRRSSKQIATAQHVFRQNSSIERIKRDPPTLKYIKV